MNPRVFDAVTLRAAVGSRRRTLLLLGGAGIAATFGRPTIAPAAKKAKKKCNKEKNQCRQAVQERCGENQSCLDSFLQCCDTCKVGQGVICAISQP
jgi:hypothetical protein